MIRYVIFKRFNDITFSLFFIILFFPLLVAIAILVKISSDGPIIYKGLRAGKNFKNFYIFKFRTMVMNSENLGGPSTALNDSRLTITGRFLRKYKLDELPQLINVLCGQMSFVGPRPQVLYYTNKYTYHENIILTVKPGITDFASLKFCDMDKVLGIGDIDKYYEEHIEPEKNKLRIHYVNKMSFITDIAILYKTFFKILKFN